MHLGPWALTDLQAGQRCRGLRGPRAGPGPELETLPVPGLIAVGFHLGAEVVLGPELDRHRHRPGDRRYPRVA
jgi:hypothetical protein